MNVPIYKLVSVTTDGIPAMISENVSLIRLCREDTASPDSLVSTVLSISKLYVQNDQFSTCHACCARNCKLGS